MAKKNDVSRVSSEMAVVVFRLKGNDQTVQDGIKTITDAISAMLRPSQASLKVIGNSPTLEESDLEGATDSSTSDGEIIGAPEEEPANANKSVKNRKAPRYSFVNDLNLRPEGKQSLKDFFAKKNPKSQQEQLAVLLYYITKLLHKSGIGGDHLYTGWKDIGLPVPKDIGHLARLTASRKGWIDSSAGDDLRMTVSGENHVEHDLPAKGTAL